MGRIETRKNDAGRGRRVDKPARLEALRRQWDADHQVFRCHYTNMPLTESHGHRLSATWEHLSPGDESSVVLVADLVNKMKSDMTDPEFRQLVKALAARFNGEPFDPAAYPQDRAINEPPAEL